MNLKSNEHFLMSTHIFLNKHTWMYVITKPKPEKAKECSKHVTLSKSFCRFLLNLPVLG